MNKISALALIMGVLSILYLPHPTNAQTELGFKKTNSKPSTSSMARQVQIFASPKKCTIEWLSDTQALSLNKSSKYNLEACIRCQENSPLEKVRLYINGEHSSTRGLGIVKELTTGTAATDHCTRVFTKKLDLKNNPLGLQKGDNTIYLEVTNKVGATQSEKLTINYVSERRLALVIGNSKYEEMDKKLANARNDAKAIAKTLRQLEFEVVAKYDLTEKEMELSIVDFGQQLHNYEIGLFYYAGHALQAPINGVTGNYLLPVDAPNDLKQEEVNVYCVNINQVTENMANSNNNTNIMILDACRDNPFKRSWSRSMSNGKGLSEMNAPTEFFLAYATAPGETAADGKGKHSPYTTQLLKYLAEANLPIELLFKKVRKKVVEATNSKQVPWDSSNLIYDFYFKKK